MPGDAQRGGASAPKKLHKLNPRLRKKLKAARQAVEVSAEEQKRRDRQKQLQVSRLVISIVAWDGGA